jgi:GAF domain-containing protein
MLLPLNDSDVRLALEHSSFQGDGRIDRTGECPTIDFIAETGRLLSDSFLCATLSTAAGLAMPALGSWCMVDVIDGESIRRPIVLHPDSALQVRARDFFEIHIPRSGDPVGSPRVVSAGQSVVVASPDALNEIADVETRELLVELGARSFLVVAMQTPRGIVGAITFGSNEPRRYWSEELFVARELGRRCARTVECARSYGETQMARVRAEHAYALEDAARAEFAYALERGDHQSLELIRPKAG